MHDVIDGWNDLTPKSMDAQPAIGCRMDQPAVSIRRVGPTVPKESNRKSRLKKTGCKSVTN